jgi:hypothetical protein
MECALVVLAAAAMGVTFGWEPVDDGSAGVEYVVQLEPELVDVLQRGDSVPIESYVPADIGPVRKVRIVVGQGDLPRTARTDAAAETPIVRGQNVDGPQNHTALFANDGWSDDRYQYDTPATWPTNSAAAPTTTSAPAWPTNGATTAPSTNSAAPLWPNTPPNDTARVAAASGQQLAPAWTSVGIDATPPPLLTPTMSAAPSKTTSGTRLGPLTKNDRYLATPFESSAQTSPAGSDWQRTAMATSSNRTTSNPESSVLTLPDPSPTGRLQLPAPPPLGAPSTSQATTGNTGWDTGWGTAATGASAADSDLVPVVPLSSRRQDQPQAAAQQSNPWAADDDRWGWPTDGQSAAAGQTVASPPTSDWPAQPTGTVSPTVPLRSDWPTSTTAAADTGWGDPRPANPAPANNQSPPTWPADVNSPPIQTMASQPTGSNTQPAPGVTGATPQPVSNPQQPWLPLLLVSLGLSGSIGANLFLGWSYMDARQRYRSLVRKTTDAFHRATGAAA